MFKNSCPAAFNQEPGKLLTGKKPAAAGFLYPVVKLSFPAPEPEALKNGSVYKRILDVIFNRRLASDSCVGKIHNAVHHMQRPFFRNEMAGLSELEKGRVRQVPAHPSSHFHGNNFILLSPYEKARHFNAF